MSIQGIYGFFKKMYVSSQNSDNKCLNSISSHEVLYKCLEMDHITQLPCNFTSKESEEIFKHRSKHKIRENNPDVKPDVTIE